jgi:cytochrome c biogenesis protein CcdA
MDEQRARYISALIYTGVSLLGAVAFLAATTLRGDYDWVARLGGAGWVFLLSMIILIPTVTPWVKKRLRGPAYRTGRHQG